MFERIVATVLDKPEGFTVTFTDSDGAPDTPVTWVTDSMDKALDWVEAVTKHTMLVVTPLDTDQFSVSVFEDEA